MKIVIYMISLLMLINCTDGSIKDTKYIVGVVDSTRRTHWGNGYFKVHVYYNFKINGKVVNGRTIDKFERSYTSSYEKGDSILVLYNSSDPTKNKVVKITDKKRKIKL